MNMPSSPEPRPKPKVALIAGPTASGKSALAMALADRTPSVIINADSMQVYSDLRVLTARPSVEDEARHPHRLFGYIDGAEACSAARWANDAKAAIAEAHAIERLPILVGGTGLYFRTLLDGIAPVPEIDADIRAAVRALPVADAHAALTGEDSEAAARLAPADTTRVARALEVVRSTGRTLKDWQRFRVGGIADDISLAPLILLPPRDWLYARIDARFEGMFSDAYDEASALRARNLPIKSPVLGAIGLHVLDPVFLRDMGKPCAIATGQMDTRQYAKRQYTWFRRQMPQTWERTSETETSNQLILFDRLLQH
ncbi:tRNA (adenosine(37)-N6)-dimethylallyltransferase MiaA [Sphingomonas sp. LT1P40]|uniref:tRNA (adenosine(37)-N6)-dimethylallyltransferase MiaA n=1 Tax=Alteristakelama amylovorans TaxID=3096166 RepID=UPI002FC8D451